MQKESQPSGVVYPKQHAMHRSHTLTGMEFFSGAIQYHILFHFLIESVALVIHSL